MRISFGAAFVVIALLTPSYAVPVVKTKGQTSNLSGSPASDSLICKRLAVDYDDASKESATSKVDGILEDSAIRQTMRESQDGNILKKSQMTLDIMKSTNCTLPSYVPDPMRYYASAMSCETAKSSQRVKAAEDAFLGKAITVVSRPNECNWSSWIPLAL